MQGNLTPAVPSLPVGLPSINSMGSFPLLNSLVSSFSKIAEAVVSQHSAIAPSIISPANVWSHYVPVSVPGRAPITHDLLDHNLSVDVFLRHLFGKFCPVLGPPLASIYLML